MLRNEHQSARMSKIKNGGLDQYATEAFKQQQLGAADAEGVKVGLYTGQVTGWVTCDVSSGTSNW